MSEELAQAGVLGALRRMEKWEGRDGASRLTFLTTVGRNAGIDELRKELRQNRIKTAVEMAYQRAFGTHEK